MSILTVVPLFLGMRGWQLIIVIVLILLLFGAKRIPSMMKNLGKGIHSFKQGMAEAQEEINKPIKTEKEKPAEQPEPKDKEE